MKSEYPTVKDLFIKYDIDYKSIKINEPIIYLNEKHLNEYVIESHGEYDNILVINKKSKFYCIDINNYICNNCCSCYCYLCYNCNNCRKYYCEECDNHYNLNFIENYDINQILELRVRINTWNKYKWGGFKIAEKDVINLIYEKIKI